jgi:serine/threonine protein kinase
LEKKNITHRYIKILPNFRDIKPENILLAKPNSLDLKITDFGVSKTLFK